MIFDINGRPRMVGGANRIGINGIKQYKIKYIKNDGYIAPPRKTRSDKGLPRGLSRNNAVKGLLSEGVPKQQIREYFGIPKPTPQGGSGRRGKKSKNPNYIPRYQLMPNPQFIPLPRKIRARRQVNPTIVGLGNFSRNGMTGGSFQDIARNALGSLASLHPTANKIYNLGQQYKPASLASNYINNSRYRDTTLGKIGNTVLSPLKWLGFGPTQRRKKAPVRYSLTRGTTVKMNGNGRRILG